MSFVKEKDIKYLEKQGVDFETEYPLFLTELYNFLKVVWPEMSHDDLTPLQNGNIDEFNKKIDYPSWGGYIILDDAFTAAWDHIHIMSNKSKALFGYFYGINLR